MKGGKGGSGRKRPAAKMPESPLVKRGPSRGEAKRKDWGPLDADACDDPARRTGKAPAPKVQRPPA